MHGIVTSTYRYKRPQHPTTGARGLEINTGKEPANGDGQGDGALG